MKKRKTVICPDCGFEISSNNFEKHINSKQCLKNQKHIDIKIEWLQPNGKYQCPDCLVEFSISNIGKHINSKVCLKNQQKKITFSIKEEWLLPNGKYQCPYCKKEYFKMGICSHIWRMHGEGKNFVVTSHEAWNKGLTKETNEIVKKYAETFIRRIQNGTIIHGFTGHKHSSKAKQKLRETAIKNKLGGVRQSQWIQYNGKTLGSSYELKLAKSLDKHNIKWDTCSRIPYIDNNGKKRTYTPDLYLIDYDIYLEPKNDFLIENINPVLGFKDTDKIKWCSEQNNITVFILNKNQLSWEYIKTLI